jgi:hypothetical protein
MDVLILYKIWIYIHMHYGCSFLYANVDHQLFIYIFLCTLDYKRMQNVILCMHVLNANLEHYFQWYLQSYFVFSEQG